MIPPTVEEKTPGVYVRSNQPDHDLDFLWDKDRKKGGESDRFHLSFFIGGFAAGTFVTLAATVLFFSSGKLIPAPNANKPPVVEEQVLTPKDLTGTQATTASPKVAAPSQTQNQGFHFPFFSPKPKAQAVTQPTQPANPSKSYTVQSGDSLGSIAIKFYHSSSPNLVDKIQRANGLKSPDAVKIGQKLEIPSQNN